MMLNPGKDRVSFVLIKKIINKKILIHIVSLWIKKYFITFSNGMINCQFLAVKVIKNKSQEKTLYQK